MNHLREMTWLIQTAPSLRVLLDYPPCLHVFHQCGFCVSGRAVHDAGDPDLTGPPEPAVCLYVGRLASATVVRTVLLHELVHLVLPESEIHGDLFKRTFCLAALESWGGVGNPAQCVEDIQCAIALRAGGVRLWCMRGIRWLERVINRLFP